ncbi:MAG: hypothetical protein ACR2FH_01700 [Caulobacteraceae bacterium]
MALALALGSPLVAGEARDNGAPPPAAATPPGPSDAGTLAKDRAIVDSAVDVLNRGGIRALEGHLSSLEAAMADAPKPFQKTQDVGDAIVYRTNDLADCLLFLGAAASPQKAAKAPAKSASCMEEPYSRAALLIGSYHNEIGEPEPALAALEAGLAVAPDDPKLITEKGASPSLQHR